MLHKTLTKHVLRTMGQTLVDRMRNVRVAPSSFRIPLTTGYYLDRYGVSAHLCETAPNMVLYSAASFRFRTHAR